MFLINDISIIKIVGGENTSDQCLKLCEFLITFRPTIELHLQHPIRQQELSRLYLAQLFSASILFHSRLKRWLYQADK